MHSLIFNGKSHNTFTDKYLLFEVQLYLIIGLLNIQFVMLGILNKNLNETKIVFCVQHTESSFEVYSLSLS